MKLSGIKSGEDQLPLYPGAFNADIVTPGSTRNLTGEFFERVACGLLGARRHKTDSHCDYCPDLSRVDAGTSTYFECKGVGKSGNAILYSKRRVKDQAFCGAGHALFYVVFHHTADVYGAADREALYAALSAGMRWAAVVEFPVIDAIAATRPVKTLNKNRQLGYGKNGYGEGYSFSVKAIRAACTTSADVPIGFRVGETPIGGFPIYTTKSGAAWLRAAGLVLF